MAIEDPDSLVSIPHGIGNSNRVKEIPTRIDSEIIKDICKINHIQVSVRMEKTKVLCRG